MDRNLVKTLAHVTPSERQLAWQAMEFTAFLHFGVNTFTDREWGTGFEDPKQFHPTPLDTDQWCRFLAEAGFKMAILTVKHHEGFCLWPTRYTKHSVVSSDWRDGQGDVMADFAASCKKYGIKAGFYLSPADLYQMESPPGFGSGLYGNESQARPRTIPEPVPGTRPFKSDRTFAYDLDDYNAHFMNQLFELLTEYGEMAEVWFDGAHPKRKGDQQYNRSAWGEMIRALQPGIIVHGNGFGEMRWVGNEAGYAREEEWSVIPKAFTDVTVSPWRDADLGSRALIDATGETDFVWMPAETDVSIRPGWFYHPAQDNQVKPPDHLHKIYLESIGRNTTLLLNFPPDPRGLIHENDVAAMREFRKRLDVALASDLAEGAQVTASHSAEGHGPEAVVDGDPTTWWTTEPWQESAELELALAAPATFNMIVLQEAVTQGQRIESFTVQAENGGWRDVVCGRTVGYKRVLQLARPVTTGAVKLCIRESRYAPTLASLSLHYFPESVLAPMVASVNGQVCLSLPAVRTFVSRGKALASPADTTGYEMRYTTDGSVPTRESALYAAPLDIVSGEIRARSFVNEAGDWRESAEAFFRIPYPREWLTVRERPSAAGESLILELREPRTITGIAFLPGTGEDRILLSEYDLSVGDDNGAWHVVCEHERLDNIVNDPTRRERLFAPVHGQYVKFVPRVSENAQYGVTPAHVDLYLA